MKTIQQTLASPWRGSEATYEMVKEQVRERWGDEVAEEFNPAEDAMPLLSWASYGYRVKKGEKALRSITFVEIKNGKGEVEKKIRRVIHLFHKRQVVKE